MSTIGRGTVSLIAIVLLRGVLLGFEHLVGRPNADWLYRELVGTAVVAPACWLIWRK